MTEQFSNLAQTTLNGAINNSVTSVVVTSAASFPSTGNFRIKVDAEFMLVTGVSSNTFTVTRGIESSTAASHSNGAVVTNVLTAGALSQTLLDQNVGYPLIVLPPGTDLASTATASDASSGVAIVINIPAVMLVDKLGFQVTVGNTGTYTWGLFSIVSNPAAATQLVTGSGTLGSTGYQTIAATGAPVTVQPGGYILVVANPASSLATIRRTNWSTGSIPIQKFQSSYTYTSTPDFTTGWTTDAVSYNLVLHGRLASGTTW